MNSEKLDILMIEDNQGDARLIQENITESFGTSAEIKRIGTLGDGLRSLAEKQYSVVLLDLTLPDSSGLDTIHRIIDQNPSVPVVVLTGFDDDETGMNAVKEGAQDYLVKNNITPVSLRRAIRYSIERHGLRKKLQDLSLTDELTGLLNRRGFIILSEQQVKLSRRSNRRMYLIYADLDNMKYINDRFGHSEGDDALIQAAKILRTAFRSSDIIARIGGDEFAVFASDIVDNLSLKSRFQDRIDEFNRFKRKKYFLSISIGIACFEADTGYSLCDMIEISDGLMYQEKKKKVKNQFMNLGSVLHEKSQ